jgi:hypothetical protein
MRENQEKRPVAEPKAPQRGTLAAKFQSNLRVF